MLRRHRGYLRIGSRGKDSFVQLLVRFLNRCLLVFQQLFHFSHVDVNRISETMKVKGQQVCIGHSHFGGAGGLCECAPVDKIGIREMGIPIEIIVNGVINTALCFLRRSRG